VTPSVAAPGDTNPSDATDAIFRLAGRPAEYEVDKMLQFNYDKNNGNCRSRTSKSTIPERTIFLWLNLQRIVDKRGRTVKKRCGRHALGGDTQVKSIKVIVMSKKGRQFFTKK